MYVCLVVEHECFLTCSCIEVEGKPRGYPRSGNRCSMPKSQVFCTFRVCHAPKVLYFCKFTLQAILGGTQGQAAGPPWQNSRACAHQASEVSWCVSVCVCVSLSHLISSSACLGRLLVLACWILVACCGRQRQKGGVGAQRERRRQSHKQLPNMKIDVMYDMTVDVS